MPRTYVLHRNVCATARTSCHIQFGSHCPLQAHPPSWGALQACVEACEQHQEQEQEQERGQNQGQAAARRSSRGARK